MRWIPVGDLRAPPERKTVQQDRVIDGGTRIHSDGNLRKDAEAELGRRDAAKVFGVRKELENLVALAWNPCRALEEILFHSGADRSARLSRAEVEQLVDCGDADERVDDPAQERHVAEDGANEIESGGADESP